jgi:branched-chain amino acid transport system permease protein
VLGAFIVLIVVAFPQGIVGMIDAIRYRRREASTKPGLLTEGIETAE